MTTQDVEIVKVLCSPPWNFSVHRAWGIVDEYQLSLDGLKRWEAFAREKNQKLATYLITKQPEPPVEEKPIDKVKEAMERAVARR